MSLSAISTNSLLSLLQQRRDAMTAAEAASTQGSTAAHGARGHGASATGSKSADAPSDQSAFAAELSAVALAAKANEVAAFYAASKGLGGGLRIAGGGNGAAGDQPGNPSRAPMSATTNTTGAGRSVGRDAFTSAEPAWNAQSAYDIVLGLGGASDD
jgi:hypothetical protein